MYPALAKAEDQRSQAELRGKREQAGGGSGWWETNDPMWAQPRQIPNGLDLVPTLRRINK